MAQNPQNTIFKLYSNNNIKIRNKKNQALRCLNITTYTGNELKSETTLKINRSASTVLHYQ